MGHPRLLLTGFYPFSNFTENISKMIVDEISTRGIDGVDIIPFILTVDQNGSMLPSQIIGGNENFSAVLLLGFSYDSDVIRIEIIGKNEYKMRIPDNSGRRIEKGPIIENGPVEILTNSPISTIELAIGESDFVAWGRDAGGFVCNETYFRTLMVVSNSQEPNTPVLFVHLPDKETVPLDLQLELVMKISKCLCGII